MSENKIEIEFDKLNIEKNIISTDLIINDEKDNNIKSNFINKGNNILNNNPFFYDLEKIMSDVNFKSFYDEYFTDFSNIKVVTLYMKLYETIQLEYKERYNCDIEKELLAYIIKQLMDDKNSRKLVLNSFNHYMEDNNPKNKRFILDIFYDNKIKEIKNN